MVGDNPAHSVVSRRSVIAGGFAVSSSLLLAGCSGGEDGASDGGTGSDGSDGSGDGDATTKSIHITQPIEPTHNYDPIAGPRAFTKRINNHIYDGLYEFGAGIELQPKIAAGSPEVERDGTRYVVEIVDDARFHNGDPVTAEDVVHSFVAPVEEETIVASDYSMLDVDSTTAVDETTVQFDLTDPYAPFDTMTVATNVVNKSVRLEDKDAYNSNPIGSGPFRYVDHVDGEYTDLERWDDYWDEPIPNIAKVRWVATRDSAARVAQIRAGDTDIIDSVPPADWSSLDGSDQIQTYYEAGIPYHYITYNINEGPTTDPDVRAGIEHAFSMGSFVEQTVGEIGKQHAAPLPDVLLDEWNLPREEYAAMENEYDPERAADLLDGNVPDGWQPTFVCIGNPALLERIASRLRDLSEYGVDIDPQVQRYGIPQFDSTVYSGDAEKYTLYQIGWTGGPDPDAFMTPLFHESSAGANQGHFYENEEFHARIEQARRSRDREERRDLYDSIIREALEQTIHTPTYTDGNTLAALPRVENLRVHPDPNKYPRLVAPDNNVDVQ